MPLLACCWGHCHWAGNNHYSLAACERGEKKQHGRSLYRPSWEKKSKFPCVFLHHHLHLCLDILSHPERWESSFKRKVICFFPIQRNVLFFRSWQIPGWELRIRSRAVHGGWQSSLLTLDEQKYYKSFIGVILSHSKHLLLFYLGNEGNTNEITYESTQGVSFENKGKTCLSMREIFCFGLINFIGGAWSILNFLHFTSCKCLQGNINIMSVCINKNVCILMIYVLHLNDLCPTLSCLQWVERKKKLFCARGGMWQCPTSFTVQKQAGWFGGTYFNFNRSCSCFKCCQGIWHLLTKVLLLPKSVII